MIVASILVVLGLLFSVVSVQVTDVRLSGVLVVPLTSVYALYDITVLIVFFAGTVLAYGAILLLRRRTLLFGRELLVASMLAGSLIPLGTSVGIDAFVRAGSAHTAFLGSILPGVAAYNLSREDTSQRRRDVVVTISSLFALLVIGVMLINPVTADLVGRHTPPVLFAQWADVAAVRGAAVPTKAFQPVLPTTVATIGVVSGIVINEFTYARWGIRLTGMVALPLLAMFVLREPVTGLLYAAGLSTSFVAVHVVARQTLLYGRVLLAIAIAIGLLSLLPVAFVGPAIPGFTLLFVGILSGLGGYNVHRSAPAERPSVVWVSGGVFVGFVACFWVLAPDPSFTPATAHVVAGAVVALGALREAARLEQDAADHEMLPIGGVGA